MSDEDLAGLSPRDLVALVRQLEARLRAVETELAAARARNAELEAELARRGGAPRAGAGWSNPTHCEACGRDLAAAPHERVGTSQVVELPPVQPVVLEAWRYQATCPHCGATTAAPYPTGFEPTRVFGPHLEALWTYLHEQHHVSYARLAALGRDLWHL